MRIEWANARKLSNEAPLRAFVAALALIGAGAVWAAGPTDPFSVRSLTADSQRGGFAASVPSCAFPADESAALTLADVIDRALCNNPQTRSAWAAARIQAAQVGVVRSAYLPTLSATASAARNRSDGISSSPGAINYRSQDATLSAAYLLYDFGARDANLESALQTLAAANFTQDATLQKVFLSATQSYYQFFAARAAVDSALEAERAAAESLKAAIARYDAGTATPADKLQAQTAYSQAMLNRIQAEGNAKSAQGVLANAMGLEANRTLNYATPSVGAPDESFSRDLDQLIARARERRPDFAAAEAQVKAARAAVQAARASGLPTVSLSTAFSYSSTSISDPFHSQAIGISLNIPIFTGFNNTYQIRLAEERVENQIALRDGVALQVALDVWQAYYSLTTGTQAVRSSADLLASAEASERTALGRYRAGVGNIIDLLTAQAALASARLQNIQALYNWYVFKATLAQAIGQLDFSVIGEPNPQPLPH